MEGQTGEISESVRRAAYLAGERLKASGLESEVVYARLEKNGVPEELAKQIVKDLWTEHKRKVITEAKGEQNFALIRIGIGFGLAVISFLVFPDNAFIPVGFMVAGIIGFFMAKKKIDDHNE